MEVTLGRLLIIVSASVLAGSTIMAGPILTAVYDPGYSSRWCSWKVKVFADGAVERYVEATERGGQCDRLSLRRDRFRRVEDSASLSDAQVNTLRRVCEEVGFTSLEPSYNSASECRGVERLAGAHNDTVELKVKVRHHRHAVQVYGWSDILSPGEDWCPHPKEQEVRRFLTLWAAVLGVAPSPNVEQTAESIKIRLQRTPRSNDGGASGNHPLQPPAGSRCGVESPEICAGRG